MKVTRKSGNSVFVLGLAIVLGIACGSNNLSELSDDDQHKYVANCGKLITTHPSNLSELTFQFVGCTYFSDGSVDYPISEAYQVRNVSFSYKPEEVNAHTCQLKMEGSKVIGLCGNFPPLTLGWLSTKGQLSLNRDIRFTLQGVRQGHIKNLKMEDVGTQHEQYRLRLSL